jgi:hypothetical protein
MREKDRGKKPIEQLRSAFPAKLDKFSDSWLQCEDLEAVRTEIDHEADVQGVHRYEDESSAIDRCRYKYNPVGELERYLPSIGVRAILTHRGVAVEILGDPRDVDAAKRWHRRVRLEGLAASCGPMDRPESTKNVEAFRYCSSRRRSYSSHSRVLTRVCPLCTFMQVCATQGCLAAINEVECGECVLCISKIIVM